jgi:hypothetical protein
LTRVPPSDAANENRFMPASGGPGDAEAEK